MKIKFRNYLIIVLSVLFCLAYFLPFLFKSKSANAQTEAEEIEQQNNYVYDKLNDKTNDSCVVDEEIALLALKSHSCIKHCSTHGPGRENGGTGILDVGCRNYYGTSKVCVADFAYWINMESINQANPAYIEKIKSDIREQTAMWNKAVMHDGTGQITNIIEIESSTKPDYTYNGRYIIEVCLYDYLNDDNPGNDKHKGEYIHQTSLIRLCYDFVKDEIGYDVDTIAHEFGHALGLLDIDSENKVDYGTHKTLMGYERGTTEENLKNAIKYPDIQGVAYMTDRHDCEDSHYMRYVQVGNDYKHICFYCDSISSITSIISGSKPIEDNASCVHDYQPMVSCGERLWKKCTKCYKVIETENCALTGNHTKSYKYKNSTQHDVVCSDCGTIISTGSHTKIYTFYDTNQHKIICSYCNGSLGYASHTLKPYIDGGIRGQICTGCLSIKNADGTWLIIKNKEEDKTM